MTEKLVYAYRVYRIRDPFKFDLRGAHGVRWDTHMTASCGIHLGRFTYTKKTENTPEEVADAEARCVKHLMDPADPCNCGIYGEFTVGAASQYFSLNEGQGIVVALCAFGGAARVGPRGLRAQQCHIVEMTVVWPGGLDARGQAYLSQVITEKFNVPFRFVDEMPDYKRLGIPMRLRVRRTSLEIEEMIRILRLAVRGTRKSWEHHKVALARGFPASRNMREFLARWDALHGKKAQAVRMPRRAGTRACACGCGGTTRSNFCPGHDSRAYKMLRDVKRGGRLESELPTQIQQGMPLRDHMEANMH